MLDVINELIDTTTFFLLLYVFFANKIHIERKTCISLVTTYSFVFMVLIILKLETEIYLLGTFTQIIGTLFFLKEKTYEKILSFLMLFSFPAVAELSLEIILRYAMKANPLEGILEPHYGIASKVLILLFLGILTFYNYPKKTFIFVSNLSKALLTVMSIHLVVTLVWVSNRSNQLDAITVLLFASCCILVGTICAWLLIVDSSRKAQTINAERAGQYLQYLNLLEKEHEEIKRLHHDISRHINTINFYINENDIEKIRSYSKSWENDLPVKDANAHFTDNKLFNAIMIEKKKKAELVGINIKFQGSLKKNYLLRTMIYVLLFLIYLIMR